MLRSPRLPTLRNQAAGLTLLEIVVVLAVVGVLAGGGVLLSRPGGALRAAQGARTFLLWARLEALWSGEAVAVVPARSPVLSARTGPDAATACVGPERRRFELARFGRVRVVEPLRTGIVWLPYGGARSCDGGGVISGRLILTDGIGHVDVIVSSLGRVRVESVR